MEKTKTPAKKRPIINPTLRSDAMICKGEQCEQGNFKHTQKTRVRAYTSNQSINQSNRRVSNRLPFQISLNCSRSLDLTTLFLFVPFLFLQYHFLSLARLLLRLPTCGHQHMEGTTGELSCDCVITIYSWAIPLVLYATCTITVVVCLSGRTFVPFNPAALMRGVLILSTQYSYGTRNTQYEYGTRIGIQSNP